MGDYELYPLKQIYIQSVDFFFILLPAKYRWNIISVMSKAICTIILLHSVSMQNSILLV